jgi:tetratricopeptide (TPR) repeat protein
MDPLKETRVRRPYEKKKASKEGALLFGLGLGAILAAAAIFIGLTLPLLQTRLDTLPYYARTAYRKLVPHPEYLPTPAPVAATPALPEPEAEKEIEPTEVDLSPHADPVVRRDATPAAFGAAEDSLPLSESPALNDIRPSVQLDGLTHQWQTWNNCGPATVTTNMSYFGSVKRQAEAAEFLKPNEDDKNVSPYELAAYARRNGMEAVVRVGGTLELLKTFLSNGFPVLTETWLTHDGDSLGHYRLITGYDDITGQFTTSDSLNGPDYQVSYEQFEADWRVFNYLYLVVYPPGQADVVAAIIGDSVNNQVMYERVLSRAQAQAEANPDDAIAYFNQGDALTRLGRYEEAAAAFDRARALGLHWRRLWYQFTPFEAYYRVGRYQDVLDLANATLKGTGGLEEAYYYRGLALQALGQPGAEEAFESALAYNPLFTPAADALAELSP